MDEKGASYSQRKIPQKKGFQSLGSDILRLTSLKVEGWNIRPHFEQRKNEVKWYRTKERLPKIFHTHFGGYELLFRTHGKFPLRNQRQYSPMFPFKWFFRPQVSMLYLSYIPTGFSSLFTCFQSVQDVWDSEPCRSNSWIFHV